MKKYLLFNILVLLNLMVFSSAHAHDDQRVSIEFDTETTLNAGKVDLRFQLVDIDTKKILTEADLSVSHEKILHLFIFDQALLEFRHEHPIFKDGMWSVTTNLEKNGKYQVWVQGVISNGLAEFSSDQALKIQNGSSANPIPTALPLVSQFEDSTSRVSIQTDSLKAGQMTMPLIKFSGVACNIPKITPYLGALAHVIITDLSGETILHVHPMAGSSQTEMMIHTTFPSAGDYRIWVQFIDHGILKVFPFSVRVSP